MPKSEKPYLPHERFDPPSTAINLIEGYLSYDCGTVVSNQSDLLTLLGVFQGYQRTFEAFLSSRFHQESFGQMSLLESVGVLVDRNIA